MRCVVLLCCLCCLNPLWGQTDDPVFSGPQIGEKLAPFEVIAVYDQAAGKQIDPVADIDGKPALLVFVHKLTRPGIALTRSITSYAHSQTDNGAMCGIVWLQDDKAKAEEYLNRARKSLNLQAPVGISVDGGEGPGAYGLNRNVELTILIAKDNKVTANFALVQPSVTEAAKIAGELAKLINQPAPSQKQMEQLAYPGGAMRKRPMQRGKNAASGLADQLRGMMRKFVAADASEDDLAPLARDIEKWVGDDKTRQAALVRMATAVLDRGLGSESAQKTIKTWKEKYSPRQ